MAIAKNSTISLHYEMFDTDNQLLGKTEEPIAYLYDGYDGIFPLVKEALYGKEVGDTVDVVLSPDGAFGEHDPELVCIGDISVFSVKMEAGMMFEADDPAVGDVTIYRVTDVVGDRTMVDGNRPLAGMKVCFRVTVDSIRDTTDEEITHDHIHGPHGHHH